MSQQTPPPFDPDRNAGNGSREGYEPPFDDTAEPVRSFSTHQDQGAALETDPSGQSDPLGQSGQSRGQRRKKRLGLVIGILVLVMGGIGYGYYAFFNWVPQADSGPPLIMADDAPVRIRPEDPGGLSVPHQDKLVYGHLDAEGAPQETIERLLPPPEVASQTTRQQELSRQELSKRSTDDMVENLPQTIDPPPMPQPPDIEGIPAPELPATVGSSAGEVSEMVTPEMVVVAEPVAESLSPDSVTPPGAGSQEKAQDGVAPVVSPTFFRVQLASFRNPDSAEQAWEIYRKKFPDILSDLDYEIVRVDLGGRGIHYRLQAGAFEQGKAEETCQKLVAKQQDCLIVKR